MSFDALNLLVQAVIALITLVGLGVPAAAYLRSRPRVLVSVYLATFISKSDARPMAVVQVVNEGGADAIVGRVQLTAMDGPEGFSLAPSEKSVGPRLPHRLDANGGRATWAYDYTDMRQTYSRVVRDGDLILTACVTIGTKVVRGKQRLVVARPGQSGPGSPPVGRVRRAISAGLRPHTQLVGLINLSEVNLDAGTYPLVARNFGQWWSKPFTVSLVASKEGAFERERVPGVEQARFPRIGPKRNHQVEVPLAEDPPPGVTLDWWVTSGPGVGIGVGALTWAEARAYKQEAEGPSAPSEVHPENS